MKVMQTERYDLRRIGPNDTYPAIASTRRLSVSGSRCMRLTAGGDGEASRYRGPALMRISDGMERVRLAPLAVDSAGIRVRDSDDGGLLTEHSS